MRRRVLVSGLAGLGITLGGLTLVNRPSQPLALKSVGRLARVGYLSGTSSDDPNSTVLVPAIRERLAQLGWFEGRNFALEQPFANGQPSELPGLAADLVRLQMDLLATYGTPATLAAMKLTNIVPIVFINPGNPVGQGLVASFAHPGGNVTGVATLGHQFYIKELELLRQMLPTLARIALFWNPTQNSIDGDLAAAMRAIALERLSLEVRSVEDVAPSLAAASAWPADAVIVLSDGGVLNANTARIVRWATELAAAQVTEWVE
jgi:putative ABC transport system substrate-binding protein